MINILLNSETSHLDLDHQSVCLFSQIRLYLIKELLQLEFWRTCSTNHKNVPNIVSVTAWSNYIPAFLTAMLKHVMFFFLLTSCRCVCFCLF